MSGNAQVGIEALAQAHDMAPKAVLELSSRVIVRLAQEAISDRKAEGDAGFGYHDIEHLEAVVDQFSK